MSKELEALEELKQDISDGSLLFADEKLEIIEKALKEYAGFQFVFKISNRNEGKKVHDKLKALEIIKKYIDIEETDDEILPYHVRDKQYVSNRSCCIMSEEEYNLLKEILL